MSIPSFSPETQSALKILDAVVKVFTNNGNLEPLVIAIKNNPKLFLCWHVSLLILLSFFCMFTFHFNILSQTIVYFLWVLISRKE